MKRYYLHFYSAPFQYIKMNIAIKNNDGMYTFIFDDGDNRTQNIPDDFLIIHDYKEISKDDAELFLRESNLGTKYIEML